MKTKTKLILQSARRLDAQEMQTVSGGVSQTFRCIAMNDAGTLREFDGWGFETSVAWCRVWSGFDYDCRCFAN